MPENTLRLEAREFKPSAGRGPRSSREGSIDSEIFFEIYSKVAALTSKLTKQNEAIELFQASKLELEAMLRKNLQLGRVEHGARTENVANTIAACHSLLALLHWLYPGKDYDRLKNANAMYQHSVGAIEFSQTPFSESYMLGLFIQLRILPFLIRSNEPLTKELSKAREKALLLISILDSTPGGSSPASKLKSKNVIREGQALKNLAQERTCGFKGLLHEGLGFSYWQLERDSEIAQNHLQQSIGSLLDANRETGSKSNYVKSKGNVRKFSSQSFSKKFSPTYIKSKTERSFYHAFTSVVLWDLGLCHEGLADKLEGDDRMRLIKKARADYERSYTFAKKTTWNNYKGLSAYMIASTYEWEAEREIEKNKIRQLLKKAVRVGDEALRWLSLWSTDESDFLAGSWIAAYYGRLADYSPPKQRRSYMLHSLKLAKKAEDLITKHESRMGGSKLFTAAQIGDLFIRNADYYKQLATNQKTMLDYAALDLQREQELVIEPLRKSLEYATRSKLYYKEDRFNKQAVHACLLSAEVCYELSNSNIPEDEKKAFCMIGKGACREAKSLSKKNEWNESVAESNWFIAQLLDMEGKYHQSASSYQEASSFYERAKNVSEHGGKVYQDFADYMLAWNKIELAKSAHVSSDFDEAANLYLKAANLISGTREWSAESGVFLAQSLIERGESKSLREEKASEAIDLFLEAISGLTKIAEDSKKKDTTSSLLGYGALAQNLITFCRARIILEKSKEAYRLGDFEKSILGLSNAETMFEDLAANPVISDSLRSNELRSMGSLCRALASFQKAQLRNDPELYLEARRIFGSSAEESKSRTLRPLLRGLASFASFLFYSNQLEKSLDTKLDFDLVEECNKALEGAKSSFKRVGNKSFLNILKASEHILDATIKMNSADREVEDVQVKAKLYAEAQRSLSLASKHYKLVGSSKRLTDALHLIRTVRNQQNLIPLAHDIIAEVASNQIIYAAIASSSVMEKTPQASPSRSGTSYVALDCEISSAYTRSGDNCNISYTVSNLSREPVTAVKIDEVLPEGFEITESPVGKLTGRSLKLNLRIDAGTSKSFSISYEPRSVGEFSWNPSLIFLDASRTFRVARSRVAHSVVEPGKITDFAALLKSKSILDANLQTAKQKLLEVQSRTETNPERTGLEERLTEEIYTIREKISRIEEELLRTRNEYDLMVEELQRIRSDIEATRRRRISASTFRGGEADDNANLLAEEKLLETRIERRRLQLEQARLL